MLSPSEFQNVRYEVRDHVAVVTLNRPEAMNALSRGLRQALRQAMVELDADSDVKVIVLTGAGERAFCAGSDIRGLDKYATPWDFRNRADYCDAIRALRKPVIAAVNGYCLGGGIGLVGNADVIVASDDATFGLPEVDRGALGAATHLSRLVPQHKMRAMVYMAATATAQELHHHGSVLEVVPRDELRDAARRVARTIADKGGVIIRAAKASLNGIDPVDVKRSYRYEQGFTFELNLVGEGDRARDAFVEKRDEGLRR